jgi:hypothetical protein
MLGGSGKIMRTGSPGSTYYGNLFFDNPAHTVFKRQGNEHVVDRVVFSINPQSELLIKNGIIQIASHPSNNFYGLKIKGKLNLQNGNISSNEIYSKSSIYLDSAGTISLTNEAGFSGNSNSAISPGVKYFLHQKSIVEFCGDNNQIINSSNTSGQNGNKFGILRLNLRNTSHSASIQENIYVRKRLELVQGKLVLNSHTLIVENGDEDGINHVRGFIDCDNTSSADGLIHWKNIKAGKHEIPFGKTPSEYLPVIFTATAGFGNDLIISTRSTNTDNLPYPSSADIISDEHLFAENHLIDRWWNISATGLTADIAFTYSENEKTLNAEFVNHPMCAIYWTGDSWNKIKSENQILPDKKGVVTVRNINPGSHFTLMADPFMQNLELKMFEAIKLDEEVLLKWETVEGQPGEFFAIEKSSDGETFFEIGRVDNTASKKSAFEFYDKDLFSDIAYYRIRFSGNNQLSISETKVVNQKDAFYNMQSMINSVSPNPFTSTINLQYNVSEAARLEITDTRGKKVIGTSLNGNGIELSNASLELTKLKSGIYFLSIISNGKKDTVKIIKND